MNINKFNKMDKKIYKEHLMADIAQMKEVAEDIINSGKLNLKPGTYTSAQIDNLFKKIDKNYFKKIYGKAKDFRSKDEAEIDIMYRYFRVSNEHGWRIYPGGAVFKLLKEYEKEAGMSGRKVSHFNVLESRKPVAVAEITFPSLKT